MGGYVEKLLGKNEKIITAARQHWTTLAITFIVNLFVAIVLIGLAIFLGNQSFTQDRSSILHLVPTVLLILLIVPVARFGWD